MKWSKRTTEKQTILEEILNAVSHGLMVPVSIVIFFIFYSKKGVFQFPVFLLTLTMFMLYLMSCLYHSLSFTKAKRHFQRFDHICIYLLIWGSFLPFLFYSEEKKLFNLIFCISQSFVILIGILLKIFQFHKDDKIHLILFLLLGWSGIWVIFDLWSIVNQNYSILLFLFLGGFFYSIGILFYNELYKKYYHFIWHLFVILANLCHVYSIFLLIK
ncbi:hemolysin III family protein [Candidatus Phytoplasma rubi]|uniref:Hemolysin III family protein n=1 Tax=Candidatus Phytoplasma rubi TaxID=399025 RepID=A0ABY7BTD5_9MOLU|nr:hemolysin III family protein [Candidatus Phytoplasma rubi]WAN63245.1 hemolysin III family protein [Candidatus Phytoplasma rubi]